VAASSIEEEDENEVETALSWQGKAEHFSRKVPVVITGQLV